MDKRDLIITIIIIGVVLIFGFSLFFGGRDGERGDLKKGKCVPSSCCHATECVLERDAPNCSGRLCTMDCRAETMDCGQGHCEFVSEKCEVIWDE